MPEISTQVSSRVFYRKMGSGPVLVLLHGFPMSSSVWYNVREQLSDAYTLIMPDFPGSGNSILEKETSIEEMADCLNAILTHEKAEKVVVAGHSMGGYVALAFAGKYPGKVAGLTLVHSTPLPDNDDKKNMRLRSIELIRKGGKTGFIRQIIPNLFSEQFKQNKPETVEELVQESMQTEV